jgi:hypothetical protein
MTMTGSVIFTLGLVYILIKKYLKPLLKKKIFEIGRNIIKRIPDFYRPLLNNFYSIRFGLFERMVRERGSSTVSMLNEIFLKQLRRLTYLQIYDDESWQFRRIMTAVYELTAYNLTSAEPTPVDKVKKTYMDFVDPSLKDVGAKIRQAALIAAKMPTTLWFEAKHREEGTLDNLIACGQFTMCYNLLIYLTELEHSVKSPLKGQVMSDPDLNQLYNALLIHWIQFKMEPLRMVKEKAHSSQMFTSTREGHSEYTH